ASTARRDHKPQLHLGGHPYGRAALACQNDGRGAGLSGPPLRGEGEGRALAPKARFPRDRRDLTGAGFRWMSGAASTDLRVGRNAASPAAAPNTTAIHGPKSGPGAETPIITRAGTRDSLRPAISSVDNGVRNAGRRQKVRIRKMPISAAPSTPVLLM